MAFERAKAEDLYLLAKKDTARNYFVCYSIDNHHNYASVWQLKDGNKPIIGVFLRNTGIIQIIHEPGIPIDQYKDDFSALLSQLPWKQAFVTEPIKSLLTSIDATTNVHDGAFIAACPPERYSPSDKGKQLDIKNLTVNDLDSVIEIYLDVFKGFASYEYMVEKLNAKRGRAIGGFIDGKLITVSQSDYESRDTAIVVGVATRLDAQGHGFGRACFEHLCNQLIRDEKKTLYLQYDSPVAGALYKSLGFEMVEQIFHVEKIEEVNR